MPDNAELTTEPTPVSAIACLDDPTRLAVYEYVRASKQPVSRSEVADAVEIPRSTAAFHLDRLAAQSLVVTQFKRLGERSGPGAGRPAKLYRADRAEISVSIPPRHYDLAAELMATAIESSSQTGAPIDDALRETANTAGIEHARRAGDIAQLLEATGYEPHSEPDGYSLGNCPFHQLAAGHPGTVCSLNRAFLEGALTGAEDDTHYITPETAGAPCCARVVNIQQR